MTFYRSSMHFHMRYLASGYVDRLKTYSDGNFYLWFIYHTGYFPYTW